MSGIWKQNTTSVKNENYKMKGETMNNDILNAVKGHAQAQIAMHQVNVMIYMKNPAGIREHSDISQAVEHELMEMAKWQDVIDMVDKYFPETPEDQMPLFS